VIPDIEAPVGKHHRAHAHRQGLSGPQRAAGPQVQGVISGQKRGVTPRIKRQLRRRSAVGPVIGHLKT